MVRNSVENCRAGEIEKPFCSTDRTEPLHQLHKADYKRSNKGPQYAEFLLNEERFTGWIAYESKLSSKDILRLNADDADGDEGTLDESDSEEDQQVKNGPIESEGEVSKKNSFIGRERWKGFRYLEFIENQFKLETLVLETKKTLQWIRRGRQPIARRTFDDWEDREPVSIRGYSALSIYYPMVHDATQPVQEIAKCTDVYYYGKNQEWGKSRYDTVLIRFEKSEGNHTMSNRRVARLLLLFSVECPVTGERLNLAYVQLFRVVGADADPLSGMFKVRKDQYQVIEIDTIERGAHLIPCFSRFDTRMADGKSTPSLDVYTDFWLNNYIDIHMYNTIYA